MVVWIWALPQNPPIRAKIENRAPCFSAAWPQFALLSNSPLWEASSAFPFFLQCAIVVVIGQLQRPEFIKIYIIYPRRSPNIQSYNIRHQHCSILRLFGKTRKWESESTFYPGSHHSVLVRNLQATVYLEAKTAWFLQNAHRSDAAHHSSQFCPMLYRMIFLRVHTPPLSLQHRRRETAPSSCHADLA